MHRVFVDVCPNLDFRAVCMHAVADSHEMGGRVANNMRFNPSYLIDYAWRNFGVHGVPVILLENLIFLLEES